MMKYFRNFLWAFFLFPFHLLAQPALLSGKDITGLWQGYITTSQKKLPYELVIAEKDGKLIGYSHTSFTVNDEEIISVKKMKISFNKDRFVIEDDDMVFNNITNEAAKKIKQINTLVLGDEPLQTILTGTFETKTNRALRPASGDVYLVKKEEAAGLKLMAKLDEMKLSNGLAFSAAKQLPSVAVTIPVPIAASTAIQTETPTAPETPEVFVAIKPLSFKEEQRFTYSRQKFIYAITKAKPAAAIIIPAIQYINPVTIVTANNPVAVKPAVVAKPGATTTVVKKAAAAIPAAKVTVASPVVVPRPAPKNIEVAPVIDLAKRKIETIEQLTIEADSLLLTLYDNGEVDGDSVSVILNGKTIVSQQRLSTVAFTKTIYITPELGDTIQLVMYAENLGSLPPNSGLLLLQFDNKRHEIRFSGDLNKNAAITLRRKKKK